MLVVQEVYETNFGLDAHDNDLGVVLGGGQGDDLFGADLLGAAIDDGLDAIVPGAADPQGGQPHCIYPAPAYVASCVCHTRQSSQAPGILGTNSPWLWVRHDHGAIRRREKRNEKEERE